MSNTENKAVKSIAEINVELAGLSNPDLTMQDIAELYADDGVLIGINQIKVLGGIVDIMTTAENVYQITNTHSTTESQKEGISVADAINAAANGTGVISGEKFIQEPTVTITEKPAPVVLSQSSPVTSVAAAPAPAPVAKTPEQTSAAGVLVKSTAAVAEVQLPEVVAAYKVASMKSSSAIKSLLDYARDMHPAKSQTPSEIEKHQVKLLSALFTILSSEDENFGVVFKAVLAIVKANRKEAFSITMVHRGLNTIGMDVIDNDKMRFLTRLIDALIVASGVNNMSQVKGMVDMTKLLACVANVKANKNLTQFFS